MSDVLSSSMPVLISPLLTRKEIASKTYGKLRYQVPQQQQPQPKPVMSAPSPAAAYPRYVSPGPSPRSLYQMPQAAPASPYLSRRSVVRVSARSVSPLAGYQVMRSPRVMSCTRSQRVLTTPVKMQAPGLGFGSQTAYDQKPIKVAEVAASDATDEPKSLLDTSSSLGSSILTSSLGSTSKIEIEPIAVQEHAEVESAEANAEASSPKVDLLPALEEVAVKDAKADPVGKEIIVDTAENGNATETAESDEVGKRDLAEYPTLEQLSKIDWEAITPQNMTKRREGCLCVECA
mmetsp:Transcript_107262/g.185911  ORF Transcript_107262/g.185911 Transcript_107262/m.185911 type:complete len:291 (-) Transcript_107262:16-888(-)